MDAINFKLATQPNGYGLASGKPNGSPSPRRDAEPSSAPEALPLSSALRAAQTSDVVELSAAPRRAASPAIRSLVAAQVSGGVNFDAPSPIVSRVSATPTSPAASALNPAGVYSMYRVPGEKNAAATAVSVGRSLDVQG